MKKGVYERVFHLIWSKSEFMSSQNNISLNLPNTILFENGQPLYWYFSNNSGNILKKKRDSVTVNNIKTFFENKTNESGIIAYFISAIPNKNQQIQYFTIELLRNFLDNNRTITLIGFLQEFIEPYGGRNTVLKVEWGRKVVILTKRRNIKNINKKKLDLYERACTFDGPEMFSEKESITGHTASSLTLLSNSIAEHIASLSYGQLQLRTMNFFYKQKKDGTIWFLWGSEASFTPEKATDALKIEIPKNIDLRLTINLQKPLNLFRDVICVYCNKPNHSQDFEEISYKDVIENEDHSDMNNYCKNIKMLGLSSSFVRTPDLKKSENQNKTNNDHIPLLIRRLHPIIKYEDYLLLKKNENFVNRKIRICFDCFYILKENPPETPKEPLHLKRIHKVIENLNEEPNQSVTYDLFKMKKELLTPLIKNKNSKKFSINLNNTKPSRISSRISTTESTNRSVINLKKEGNSSKHRLLLVYKSENDASKHLKTHIMPYINILNEIKKK